jgi:hypothetical protein
MLVSGCALLPEHQRHAISSHLHGCAPGMNNFYLNVVVGGFAEIYSVNLREALIRCPFYKMQESGIYELKKSPVLFRRVVNTLLSIQVSSRPLAGVIS